MNKQNCCERCDTKSLGHSIPQCYSANCECHIQLANTAPLVGNEWVLDPANINPGDKPTPAQWFVKGGNDRIRAILPKLEEPYTPDTKN